MRARHSGDDGRGHTARVWDATTGQAIGEPLRGHEDVVSSAAFSPDGKRIVTASADETVRLWDAATGKPIAEPLRGHDDVMQSAAFSPDGKRIVTASRDGTARLWEIFSDAQSYVQHAKMNAPRCLSPAERQKYFLPAEPPSWCAESSKFPYDRLSVRLRLIEGVQRLIERGNSEIQNKDYQPAFATFSKAIELLDQADADLLAVAYFGRGKASDGLQKYSDAIADFRTAQELGKGDVGDWLWWATERLSQQKLRAGAAVEALLINLHNYLSLTPAVRRMIEVNALRIESHSTAYPLGALPCSAGRQGRAWPDPRSASRRRIR
jgi:tetratricopeptide (TPR) repeat protein